MGKKATSPSSWLYPDRDRWESLLSIRPKPQPVMEKPTWWSGRWPAGAAARATDGSARPQQILARVVRELSWAQKCFLHAQSVLPDCSAKNKAGRIGEALGRTRKAIDVPEKAEDIVRVIDELSGVGRYDPGKHPRRFVETAAASLAAAAAVLAACPFEAVAYWGRTLTRASRFFGAMKHELPGG